MIPSRRCHQFRVTGRNGLDWMIPYFLVFATSLSRCTIRTHKFEHPLSLDRGLVADPKSFRSLFRMFPTVAVPSCCVHSTPISSSADVAAVVWFRNDLRLHDHEPLWRASQGVFDLDGNFEVILAIRTRRCWSM